MRFPSLSGRFYRPREQTFGVIHCGFDAILKHCNDAEKNHADTSDAHAPKPTHVNEQLTPTERRGDVTKHLQLFYYTHGCVHYKFNHCDSTCIRWIGCVRQTTFLMCLRTAHGCVLDGFPMPGRRAARTTSQRSESNTDIQRKTWMTDGIAVNRPAGNRHTSE